MCRVTALLDLLDNDGVFARHIATPLELPMVDVPDGLFAALILA